jgi:CubicO group peptidase (beta-lactamase class C family)
MMGRIISFVALLWASVAAHADAVDDAVTAEMAKQGIPGLSMVIVKDGKIERMAGYGRATLEHEVAVTPDTVFQAGSTAKQFTAIAILMLERDGKLKLSDRLSAYFPDTPNAWGDIKLSHLLSHVGGIKDDEKLFALQTNPDNAAIRQQIWKTPRTGPAGASFLYSDMGYVLLGQVIEKVTGAPYHRYLDDNLFKPLDMAATRALSDRAVIAGRASGYEKVDGVLLNQDWVSPAFNSTADGSTYITARDFAAYLVALDAPPAWFLPFQERITRPTRLNNGTLQPYGMGWFLARIHGTTVQYHTGSWQGFKAIIVRYPASHQSIALLTNANVTDGYALVAAIVAKAMPGLPPPPPTSSLKPVPASKWVE